MRTWLKIGFVAVCFAASNGLTYYFSERETVRTECLVVSASQIEETDLFENDSNVWIGVLLDEELLEPDEEKNIIKARGCLKQGSWKCLGNGRTDPIPRAFIAKEFQSFPKGKVYIFQHVFQPKMLARQ